MADITDLIQPPEIKKEKGESWSGLTELWLETYIDCPHRCSFCFNSAGGIRHEEGLLSEDDYLDFLRQFKELGGKTVGLPGAGEPLFGKNKELTLKIADYCSQNNMHLVIFTSGYLLNDELIKRFNRPNISFMIKYNTFDEPKQDTMVGTPGYSKRRNENIEKLIEAGFTRDYRLGFVNSIMTENYEEIPNMFRYCRDRHIIPDFDTLQEKGKGATCGLCSQDEKTKMMFQILQEIDEKEYGYTWHISPTYVAGKCERYKQHLYVDRFGNVSPCLGTHLDKVTVGNLKDGKHPYGILESIWLSHPLVQKIREREYEGACTRCTNYQQRDCNSCLGRYATIDTATNTVMTRGCWNYKESKDEDTIAV
ncbi:MAG: radical SAM protein [Nanoarchaeota archaeon]